jgi:hypothetical protein
VPLSGPELLPPFFAHVPAAAEQARRNTGTTNSL